MIRRGEDWGSVEPVPPNAIEVADNASLYALLGRTDPMSIGPIVLTGGDLARTLGVSRTASAPASGVDAPRVELDVTLAVVDGAEHRFAAHAIIRNRWWTGRIVAIANAAFLGEWNIGPKAHPGDGRVDVIDAKLSVGDKVKAWRRLQSGTHLPHPDIATRQVRHHEFDFSEPRGLWLDGVFVGPVRKLEVTVEPASLSAWLGS